MGSEEPALPLPDQDPCPQHLLQKAAGLAQIGYFVFNTEQDVVEICSDRHAEIFGHTPERFIASVTGLAGDMPMIDAEDRATIHDAYRRLKSGQTVEFEYRFFRTDGSIGHVREYVSPQTDAFGRVVRGFGSSLDLSALRETDAAARQASKMAALGELTAGVAHDFNNLLASIMGNAELIEADPDPTRQAEYVHSIVEAARRGGLLTRSLLNFAQRAPIQPAHLDLNGPVGEVASTFHRTLLQPVTFSESRTPAPLPVHVDREQLDVVLLQLLVNARDATEGGGAIRISTNRVEVDERAPLVQRGELAPGPYACVRIEDTGSGIDPADLPRVTEPFFTTKGRAQRSGLGLSMASGFARQSRGTLDIRSTRGEGTSVALYFPLAIHPEAAPHPDDRPLSGKRVLLLEDDEALQTMMQRMLTAAGVNVISARDGSEAARHLAHPATFDLAILDNILPGQRSGAQLARDLKMQDPSKPVVLLSGHIASVDAALAETADAVLQKPVSLARLLNTLERCLQTS